MNFDGFLFYTFMTSVCMCPERIGRRGNKGEDGAKVLGSGICGSSLYTIHFSKCECFQSRFREKNREFHSVPFPSPEYHSVDLLFRNIP